MATWKCPECGCEFMEYGECEIDEDGVRQRWECPSCSAVGWDVYEHVATLRDGDGDGPGRRGGDA